ncbi:MAG TPA: sigma 54-interacting transcriptional regulator, partial [Phycisphaerae bacterium]|nr:sigma 54-interacting transcriptional regulator [Phycisphaerae bacterium]
YWTPEGFHPTVEWDLAGTPCEDVVKGALCHYPTGVATRFPNDKPLVAMGIESYLGVPLKARDGQHLGHLAVFDPRPLPREPQKLQIFQIFAARAAAELERLRYEKALAESEIQFRDLYEEAPIAYVHEATDSRFISANKAALRLLGVKPEEVEGTWGMQLVAPLAENKTAIENAFKATASGRDQTLPILELRRKDNGKPLWVRWWSRPDRDGKTTRTMFIDITEQVLMEREKNRLQQQNIYLQEEIKAAHNFEEIVGRSPAIRHPLDLVRQVAATDSSVLITGETGTGKELFARAIHSTSPRRDKPLIKVNCAALPSGLVESELFGHEKGAFSGAISKRIGRFELANTGTIFLDEIGEMPLDVQAKLLRVLQEREFERVGSGTPIKCDVRIIAATNRDLLKCVQERTFREDLYYRLNVFPLHLPALRERKDDIPLLIEFLARRAMHRIGKKLEAISAETLQRIVNYPWPGNIRELENIVERAVILSAGPQLEIGPDILPNPGPARAEADLPDAAGSPSSLESVERAHILQTLTQSSWVIEGPAGAAAKLNLHPNTLRGRMKKLGLSRPAHS